MNEKVDKVIAPNMELTEMIVPGEGIESQKPAMAVRPDTRDIGQLPDDGIIADIIQVIEMERGVKRIRIDHRSQDKDNGQAYTCQ